MNQLLIGYTGYLDVSGEPEGRVGLNPRVIYHQVAGLDAGYGDASRGVWVSGMLERPIRDRPAAEWTTQEVTPARVVSVGAQTDLFGKGESALNIHAGYIWQWGGDAADQGALAVPGKSIFETRYPFKSAVRVGGRTPLPGSWGRHFAVSTQYSYDFKIQGALLSSDLVYRLGRHLQISVGGDIAGVGPEGDNLNLPNYLSEFRTNDRVHGGLAYVF